MFHVLTFYSPRTFFSPSCMRFMNIGMHNNEVKGDLKTNTPT